MLKILHAADLHLDTVFAALPPEQAAQRRRQQRQLPRILVEMCVQRGCDLLLLAGDVFDGARVCPETVEALQAAFAQCPVPVCIAPGNHDPYTAASPWATAVWPDNVHIFTGGMACVSLSGLHCRIWGAAFQGTSAQELLQPVPPSGDGWLEIGVFHGDPVYDSPYHPIPGGLLRNCGLDYLALGHIHRTCLPVRAGKTWYGWPGAAMGRGFDETGEKGVFCVELEQGSCRTEWIPLPLPRYEIRQTPAEQISLPPMPEQTICRLVLIGESEPVDTEALHRRLADRFLALEIVDQTVPKRDLWAACGENTLRGLALQNLKAQYDAAGEADRQTAAMAARFVLAALEGRELP